MRFALAEDKACNSEREVIVEVAFKAAKVLIIRPQSSGWAA